MGTMEQQLSAMKLENEKLRRENDDLRRENEELKERAVSMDDANLLLDDFEVDVASAAGDELPLYRSSRSPARRQTSTSSASSTSAAPSNNNSFSRSSLARAVALPIAAISSTVCMLDNVSDVDDTGQRRLSGAAESSPRTLPATAAVLACVMFVWLAVRYSGGSRVGKWGSSLLLALGLSGFDSALPQRITKKVE
jgi:hypothetical protein